jgi:HAD superfamily hydrolase (TIGR01662 family)
MGRYSGYMKEIWSLEANRKPLAMTLFGVILDNQRAFTPGDQLSLTDEVAEALPLITKKGYDLLIIAGQPPNRTRNLEVHDFDNILAGFREISNHLGVRIKNAYYAPSTDKNDPYVKPNTGMFERAQNENMIKWEGSYYIGAELNDVKAAVKMKAKPVLLKQGNVDFKTKGFELTNHVKIKEYQNLLDFAKELN